MDIIKNYYYSLDSKFDLPLGVKSWVHAHPTTTKIMKIAGLIFGIGLLSPVSLPISFGIRLIGGALAIVASALLPSTVKLEKPAVEEKNPLAEEMCPAIEQMPPGEEISGAEKMPSVEEKPPAVEKLTVQEPVVVFTPIDDLWRKLIERTEEGLQYIRYLSPQQVAHRFSNVVCPASTAVVINGRYLHANNVGQTIANSCFIASQAPLIDDLETFWRAIFENDSTIFDLTTPKDQINKYYPERLNDQISYGSISVSLIEIEDSSYIYNIEDGNKKAKNIQRHHWTNWPDHGVVTVQQLHGLVEKAENVSSMSRKPLLIHCRAGVGRTGTLITALVVKEKINGGQINKENLEESLLNIIVELRKQRGPLFVQTQEQLDLVRQYAIFLLELTN